MRKGGFRGHISEDMRLKVNVVRFQSDKVHMSYQVTLECLISRFAEPKYKDIVRNVSFQFLYCSLSK